MSTLTSITTRMRRNTIRKEVIQNKNNAGEVILKKNGRLKTYTTY
jgi:hypothetical protein